MERPGPLAVVPPGDRAAGPVAGDALTAAVGPVLRLLVARLGMDSAVLSLNDRGRYVVLAAEDRTFGLGPGPLGVWAESLCGLLAAGAGPSVAPDLRLVPAYRALADRADLPVRAYCGAVLRDQDGRVLGSLCLLAAQPRDDRLHDGADLLAALGAVLAQLLVRELAAQQARAAEDRALVQARTDTLTGALNRRGWQDTLQETERACRHSGEEAAVFVLDVDDLKKVNDDEGHDAGDALLQRAASALTDAAVLCALRRSGPAADPAADLTRLHYAVARTGGDEFAVLLPRVGPLDCAAVADELRRALADTGVRASLGWAARHPVRGLALACRDADQLLLADKRRRLAARVVPSPRPSPEAAGGPPAAPTAAAVGRLLCRVRELFGLESAFVSRFVGSEQVFTFINTAVPLPIAVGDRRPRAISLCQRVLAGRLPHVITDARRHPDSAEIDVVRAGLVRAYLTVPVRLPDGTLYGTMCCLSSSARPDLTAQAEAALAFAAEQVGELLGRDSAQDARRRAVQDRLDGMLGAGVLRMALQPVVDLDSGEVIGAEALARFGDGRGPETWFGEAREVGESGRLELAAYDAAVLLAPAAGFLAVNLSPPVLLSAALQERLARTPPDVLARLVVELTEHEPVEDYTALAAALAVHRARGLRLAVDDTGAGHSTLSHVLELRPDVIKLDRRLVTAIDRDPVRRALVTSLRHFCTQAGVLLVAEGVESAAEADVLRAAGVRYGQGFHLGRPVLASAPRS